MRSELVFVQNGAQRLIELLTVVENFVQSIFRLLDELVIFAQLAILLADANLALGVLCLQESKLLFERLELAGPSRSRNHLIGAMRISNMSADSSRAAV